MFERILLAIADAEDTAETIESVAALALAFSAEVVVFHARERIVGPRDEVREEETISESRRYGEEVSGRLSAAGIRTRLAVEDIRPEKLGELILAHADAERAELIVIGGHHPHNLRESVFGDIGKTLVHRAHCPVLLMPSAARTATASGKEANQG